MKDDLAVDTDLENHEVTAEIYQETDAMQRHPLPREALPLFLFKHEDDDDGDGDEGREAPGRMQRITIDLLVDFTSPWDRRSSLR